MSRYSEYLIDIKDREKLGLKPKPIDDALLLSEIISNIKDLNSKERSKSLQFFIYNVLPGTTSAANVKLLLVTLKLKKYQLIMLTNSYLI